MNNEIHNIMQLSMLLSNMFKDEKTCQKLMKSIIKAYKAEQQN